MQYIKVKFLKSGQPAGRSYTYKSQLDLEPGDKVELPGGKHGVVVDEPVDMGWVQTYGEENLKEIVKRCDPIMVMKNWSLFSSGENMFTAPELLHYHLQGNVYGNQKFNDGDHVQTSRIVQIEDKGDHKDIITRSGSRYSVYPEDVNLGAEKQFPGYYERLKLEVIE